jgi:hypothetical protein
MLCNELFCYTTKVKETEMREFQDVKKKLYKTEMSKLHTSFLARIRRFARSQSMNSNIVQILLSYFNEVVHAEVAVVSLTYSYIIIAGPLPPLVDRISNLCIWSLATLMTAVGVAKLCISLLYVAKFDTVFSGNPVNLGRIAFMTAVLSTFVPNVVVAGLGRQSRLFGVALHKSGRTESKFDFLAWHLVAWTLGCMLLFLLTYVGVPLFFKIRGNYVTYHISYFPEINFRRLVLGLFCFAVYCILTLLANDANAGGHITFYNFIFLATLNTLLLFQLTDKDACLYVRRKLHNFLDTHVHPESGSVIANADIPMTVQSPSIWSNTVPHSGRHQKNITGFSASPRMMSRPRKLTPAPPPDYLSLAVERLHKEAALYEQPKQAHDYCRTKNM